MIRINLIRGTAARKAKGLQWDVNVEAGVGAGLLVFVLGFCMYYSGSLNDEIEARMLSIGKKNQQIAQLKQKVKKVENFEQKKKELETKNRVIEQLEKRRSGPVRLLDVLSQSLEPLKVWLVTLGVKNNLITLQGRAVANDDIVGFVNNLRRADMFQSVQLGEIRAKEQNKERYFEFKLTMVTKG